MNELNIAPWDETLRMNSIAQTVACRDVSIALQPIRMTRQRLVDADLLLVAGLAMQMALTVAAVVVRAGVVRPLSIATSQKVV